MMTENVQVTRSRPRQPIESEHQETKDAQALARTLVTDSFYLTNLRNRLRAGKAGAMESTLWSYAFGKSEKPIALDLDLSNFSDEKLDQFEVLVNRATKPGSKTR